MRYTTMQVLDRALFLTRVHGMPVKEAIDQAFNDELALDTHDTHAADVLDELHTLGFMLETVNSQNNS